MIGSRCYIWMVLAVKSANSYASLKYRFLFGEKHEHYAQA